MEAKTEKNNFSVIISFRDKTTAKNTKFTGKASRRNKSH